MKDGYKVYLHVYDQINNFYTHTTLGTGHKVETMELLDPQIGEQLNGFLQIYKLQNPDSKFTQDEQAYYLFSWNMEEIAHEKTFSALPYPNILFAINSPDDPKGQAYRLKINLENLPEPKETLKKWFDEIGTQKGTKEGNVIIESGTFINSPVLSANVRIESKIDQLKVLQSVPNSDALAAELKQFQNKIEKADDLEYYEKTSALNDLGRLTDQITKPSHDKQEEALEHYLERIKNVTEKSSGLIQSVISLAKILGIG